MFLWKQVQGLLLQKKWVMHIDWWWIGCAITTAVQNFCVSLTVIKFCLDLNNSRLFSNHLLLGTIAFEGLCRHISFSFWYCTWHLSKIFKLSVFMPILMYYCNWLFSTGRVLVRGVVSLHTPYYFVDLQNCLGTAFFC